MNIKKFQFKIVSSTVKLTKHKINSQFIFVNNIKIETVESYLDRGGMIIHVATKVRRKPGRSKKYQYPFQIAA